MALSVSRIHSMNYTAYQVSMANAAAVVQELLVLYEQLGIQSTTQPASINGVPELQISIRQPNHIDQIANMEDWIVTGAVDPSGPKVIVWPNVVFLQTFTTDVPLTWGATTTAPVANVQTGLATTIVTTLPSSPNGPWTWTLNQTDETDGTTTSSVVTPNINVQGAVSIGVSNLVGGHVYTFDIEVATQYQDVTPLTSLPTQPITATA